MKAIDLFCGAGGMTQGAIQAGVNVVLAVNHWRPAIYSHEDNHPETRHICARIEDINPHTDPAVPRGGVDLLMGGPSCTHHSVARGGRPINDQLRTSPWRMLDWAEACRPKWVVIENVPEFTSWGPIGANGRPLKSRKGETFEAWIAALRSLNYAVEWRILNAADYGAPTKRRRLFVVAKRGRGAIPWPTPTHCPEGNGKPRWRAAAEIIDWAQPCPSIFDRKRPLADNTLRRIEAGLRKFLKSEDPFVVRLRGTDAASVNGSACSVREPLGTVSTSGAHHGLAQPFLYRMHGPGSRDANYDGCHDPREPVPTLLARNPFGVIAPYLVQYHNGDDGTRRCYDPRQPLPTLDTQNRYAVATPFVADVNHGGSPSGRLHDMRQPLPTVTAARRGQAAVLPFLVKYYGTATARPVSEPLDALTAKSRFGLATAELVETMGELGVADIGFRMLEVPELLGAQGFPKGYDLHGTKAEMTRQVGNSVPPPVMEAICRELQS